MTIKQMAADFGVKWVLIYGFNGCWMGVDFWVSWCLGWWVISGLFGWVSGLSFECLWVQVWVSVLVGSGFEFDNEDEDDTQWWIHWRWWIEGFFDGFKVWNGCFGFKIWNLWVSVLSKSFDLNSKCSMNSVENTVASENINNSKNLLWYHVRIRNSINSCIFRVAFLLQLRHNL